MKIFFYIPRKIAILLILAYQKTLSPDHGLLKGFYPYGYCKYYPSCSEYAKQAVDRFGVFKGIYVGLKRIIRCNPWTESKVDLIPQQ